MALSWCSAALAAAILVAVVVSFPETALNDRIIVGGTNHWRFGFNYNEWAFRNGPFYLNDTLVFMYDPPSNTTPPHSVYLLRDFQSFMACDLKGAKMVAGVTSGGGQGFELVLRKGGPLYFACGERNGVHCRVGTMKFHVYTLPFKRCHGFGHN